VNLAVYSEAPGSLAANTQLVARVTQDHACRAIVIAADLADNNDRVEAWISAHCHVSRAGSKQICSEQLSFSLAGCFTRMLPNLVFSHLDSDLPFYLWWQGDLPDPIDPHLWTWVDRLIYDSRGWKDFDAQMRLVEIAQQEANHRVVLCDLNWTRLVQLRLALAQFFDHPSARQMLDEIERVAIDHAPEYRSTALLLAGWLAAQLRWKSDNAQSNESLRFVCSDGSAIDVELREQTGEPIARCNIVCGASEFRVEHKPKADLLDVSMHVNGSERMHQLMPAGCDEPVALISEELMRGGAHRVYLRAVNTVRGLI
jgi:glucose-6-phosphate dehydrogenase assembly protein OpcA